MNEIICAHNPATEVDGSPIARDTVQLREHNASLGNDVAAVVDGHCAGSAHMLNKDGIVSIAHIDASTIGDDGGAQTVLTGGNSHES